MQRSHGPDAERKPDPGVAARNRGSIRAGIGLVFLLHLLQILFVWEDPAMLVFAGITQFAYVLPATIVLALRGRLRSAGGALIGGGITLVFNALVVAASRI